MSVKKYNIFISEKKKQDQIIDDNLVDFVYSKDFGEIIRKIKNNKISKSIILSYDNLKSPISYIDSTKDDDIISYLPGNISKDTTDSESWSHNRRQTTRIGRMVKKIFGEEFTETEIEDFVNKYKSIQRENKTFFKIVKGEDIRKYYSEKNVVSDGELGNSCMRYSRCQDYLDLYVENPKKIRLLLLFSKDNENVAIGRSLLWKVDYPKKGNLLMDRIYTTNAADKNLFVRYAKDNGIYLSFNDTDRGYNKNFYTKLKPVDYEFYPYLDTLFLYQPKTGIITDDIKNIVVPSKVYILDDIYGQSRVVS